MLLFVYCYAITLFLYNNVYSILYQSCSHIRLGRINGTKPPAQLLSVINYIYLYIAP